MDAMRILKPGPNAADPAEAQDLSIWYLNFIRPDRA